MTDRTKSEPEHQCRGLHHAGIVVPDLDQAELFYTALTQFKKVRETTWSEDNDAFNQVVGLKGSAARLCLLQGPNCFLELFEYSSPASATQPSEFCASDFGFRHLSLEVDNVAAALQLVTSLGGTSINSPVTNDSGTTATYCRDPFGNLIELISPAADGSFPPLAD